MYTVDYFIKKFEVIPEEKWCQDILHDEESGRYCALGHCGVDDNNLSLNGEIKDCEEGKALSAILKAVNPCSSEIDIVGRINDGVTENYKQSSAKTRILAALYDIKKSQEPEVKIVTKYVRVEDTLVNDSFLRLVEAGN